MLSSHVLKLNHLYQFNVIRTNISNSGFEATDSLPLTLLGPHTFYFPSSLISIHSLCMWLSYADLCWDGCRSSINQKSTGSPQSLKHSSFYLPSIAVTIKNTHTFFIWCTSWPGSVHWLIKITCNTCKTHIVGGFLILLITQLCAFRVLQQKKVKLHFTYLDMPQLLLNSKTNVFTFKIVTTVS